MINRSTVVSLGLLLSGFWTVSGCGSDATGPTGAGGATHTGGTGGRLEAGGGGESGEVAGAGSCVPRTCETSGIVCGLLDDGCGHRISCDAGCETAGAGGGGECAPTTCSAEHKDCGRISDGCGHELDCGSCDGTCGAVEPNVCGCPPPDEVFDSSPRTAGSARSEGFAGTEAQYLELYDTACSSVDDCETACADRGGTDDMCAASECLDDAGDGRTCLPAPTWSNLQGIQAESDDVTGAVELVVVATPYHDRLLTSDFALDLPDAAVVKGISVEVRRAGDASVSDDSIRLLKHGSVGGAERGASTPWTEDLEWVTYGGPSDLWGETWTAQDLVAGDFGVALSVNYEDTVGNTRAYVDQVRVTVHYSIECSN